MKILLFSERRKRQRAEDSLNRRREFQERFNTSGMSRRKRQSTDTVRSLKRDVSIESARAGLLRDFDPTEYYVGTPYETDYGANSRMEQDYSADQFSEINSENMHSFSNSRVGPPPRGIFDDI